MPGPPPVRIDGIPVYGVDVDTETRCAHYDTDRDNIAIKFACCGDYYPCLECHDDCTTHKRTVWPGTDFACKAVLCGACGTELQIRAYLDADSACPACNAPFNPGCRTHWPEYFDVDR